MRKYEGAFILLSNLEEDVRNAEIEKIQSIINSVDIYHYGNHEG